MKPTKKRKVFWLKLSEIWPREIACGDFANDYHSLKQIKQGILRGDKIPPVKVWRCAGHYDYPAAKGRWVLVNGHHRYTIAKRLKLKKIPCVLTARVAGPESPGVVWKRKAA